MKVKLKRKKVEIQVFAVETPYFYKHDLGVQDGYSVIYGCINSEKITSIKVSMDSSGKENYEIQISKIYDDEVPISCALGYESFTESNEYEFRNAMIEASRTLQSIRHELDIKL